MNHCKGIPGRHCCSYAINDDPKRELCDVCLREKRISKLEAALRMLLDALPQVSGEKIIAARAVLEKK